MGKTIVSGLVFTVLLVALPGIAAENRSGGGIGLESGMIEADRSSSEIDFVGFSLFYKQGITDHWGILGTYRDLKDDEDFFDEDQEYTQFSVHAVYMWRAGKKVRPHVKLGLAYTDFEVKVPGPFSESDSGSALSIGGGLEAGSEKVAFFGDFDYSEPEIEIFGNDEDLEIGSLTVGIIFKY